MSCINRSIRCVASSGAAHEPHRRDARRHALRSDLLHAGTARGLDVSPGGLRKNELVQRQVRDHLARRLGTAQFAQRGGGIPSEDVNVGDICPKFALGKLPPEV
jgi:hypothetical protein